MTAMTTCQALLAGENRCDPNCKCVHVCIIINININIKKKPPLSGQKHNHEKKLQCLTQKGHKNRIWHSSLYFT